MDKIDKQNILFVISIMIASIFVGYLISQPMPQTKTEINKDNGIEMSE